MARVHIYDSTVGTTTDRTILRTVDCPDGQESAQVINANEVAVINAYDPVQDDVDSDVTNETHYNGTTQTFSNVAVSIGTVRQAWNIRRIRNYALDETDKIFLAETAPRLTYAAKKRWTSYRESMRQVPQQAGFPTSVTWPGAPVPSVPLPSSTPLVLINQPFMDNQVPSLSSLVTFTRSGTAMYWNKAGVLVQAATDVPRFEFDPVTHDFLGLLIESSRTNLLTYSGAMGGTNWTSSNVTVTLDNAIAPDGTMTATRLVENTAASVSHWVNQNLTLPAATTEAMSFFVKAGTRSALQMVAVSPGMTTVSARFSLAGNGSVLTGSANGASIYPVGGGWFRVFMWFTTVTGGTTNIQFRMDNGSSPTYTGDGVSSLYLWGAQVEAGNMPTSYIPTTTAAVTRNVENAVATLGPWWSAAEGTLYVEHDYDWSSGYDPGLRYAVQLDADVNNSIYVYNRLWTRGGVQITTAGASVFNNVGETAVNDMYAFTRSAVAFKASDFGLSVDGVAHGTQASGTVPPNMVNLRIGGSGPTTSKLNGHVRDLRLYPTRLVNAEAMTLSA